MLINMAGNYLKKAWISIAAGVLAVAAGGAYLLRDTSFMHNVILHDNPATGAVRTSMMITFRRCAMALSRQRNSRLALVLAVLDRHRYWVIQG